MVVLFCNKCFRSHTFDKTLEFYLSKCSHVLCRQCVAANCPVCSKPYNPNKISKHMPSAMLDYFDDPMKIYRRYQQAVQFQFAQQTRFIKYWQEHGFKARDKLQKEASAMRKSYAELDAKTEKQKQRIQKMKAYLAFHERRNEQGVPRRPSGGTRHEVLKQCSQHFFPPTPTVSSRPSNKDESLGFNSFDHISFKL